MGKDDFWIPMWEVLKEHRSQIAVVISLFITLTVISIGLHKLISWITGAPMIICIN